MRYRLLVSTMLLALGGGAALADDAQQKSDSAPPAPAVTYFETDSSTIDESTSEGDLQAMAKFSRCHPKQTIIIEGHADKTGSVTYNARLSSKRALALRSKLIEMGARPNQLVLVVLGETQSHGKAKKEDRRAVARSSAVELDAG